MTSFHSLKHIKSLQLSKFRQKYSQFIIEGRKSVDELIHSDYEVLDIYTTKRYYSTFDEHTNVHLLSDKEYASISQFKTPAGILASAKMKDEKEHEILDNERITLLLDGVSDPGNLGTLIRTADWFGITQIIGNESCADFYNHKTLSSTMGSFTRVSYKRGNLAQILNGKNSYGAFLNGEILSSINIKSPAYIVIGSESNGISSEIEKHIKNKVFIPGANTAESLNASVAGGILMHDFFNKIK